MAPQVLDIGTICPKCDFEFVVTYVSHKAEAAEARADTYAGTIETLVNEKAQLEAERDAQFKLNVRLLQENIELSSKLEKSESERDEARRQIAAAIAEEREECAKVAGSNKSHTEHGELGECCDTAEEIAAAIRARK